MFAVLLFVLIGLASPAAASEKFALQSELDHVWTMTAACLVFFMQAGFMLLEAGSVRSKNSVNVAQKNLIDFLLSTICFGAVGFAFMFGSSHMGIFGWSTDLAFFGTNEDWSMTFFVFQLVFCGTAATVVSGAVAERMTMSGYILCTVLIGLLIYPIVGHWAWGGLLDATNQPWLARLGFMDFAGGTVVHSVGAWVALAAIIVIGPRKGKFAADGTPRTLHGHSPILSTIGGLIIWVGWIGFNGGSTLAGSAAFAHIIMNTMICAAVSGTVALFIGYRLNGHMTPGVSINGVLGGLVAITPGCDVLTGQTSMLLGILTGALVVFSERWIEFRWKLDDPLGAVSVHGVCGAFGTIMLAVLAQGDAMLAGGRLFQVGVQVLGVGVVFLWAFGVAYIVLRFASRWRVPSGGNGLRVSEEHQELGLNVTEHNAPLGTGVLHAALAKIANDPEKGYEPIVVERGDEAYEMAQLLNSIMGELHAALKAMDGCVQAAARGDFSQKINLDDFAGTPQRLCAGFNAINDVCLDGLNRLQQRLQSVANGDLRKFDAQHLKGQFAKISEQLEFATSSIGSTISNISASADKAADMGHIIAVANAELAEQGDRQEQSLTAIGPVLEDVSLCSEDYASRATYAANMCRSARDEARQGTVTSGEAVSRMQDVSAATREIEAAVDLIEGIAKQTNLLAINAAVEATKVAGNNTGQGFKVVAQEVRKLAEDTRSALEMIRSKSGVVTRMVAEGQRKVEDVGEHLAKIAAITEGTATKATEVADAGLVQRDKVQNVEKAVDALRNSSGRTRRLIDRTSKEAAELTSDAEQTAALLGAFKTDPSFDAAA